MYKNEEQVNVMEMLEIFEDGLNFLHFELESYKWSYFLFCPMIFIIITIVRAFAWICGYQKRFFNFYPLVININVKTQLSTYPIIFSAIMPS